jgi:cytochrome P450
LNREGEDHRAWRQLMARTFTPHSVEKLKPFLQAQARQLTEELARTTECEFMGAFARKLPSLGLCELIGVPSADRERFCALADTIGLGFNFALLTQRIRDVDAALDELLEYAASLIAERRREPRDDLVTRLARVADEEGGFPEQSIVGSVAGLVFAGHETTKNQLGWMVAILAEVPAEWERVARDPARARDVVEEILRFRSAATSLGRTVVEDMTYAGRPMAAGTRVGVSLWGANRDPSAFPDPDRFDVELHRESPQIAFGHGPHHCLGAALARAELNAALVALTARITCPRVLPGATFLPPLGINGPVSLPIAYTVKGA